jgi:serine/threonine protein kinase
MNSGKEPVKKKIKINKVNNRFLPLTESVINGLEPEATIKDFTILSTIGEGSFGKVFLVMHNKTKSKYAIKRISKLNKNNQEGKTYFRREIEIMYKVHQCNIVRLFNHFEDNEYCYFVMEYIEKGNLFDQPSWKNNKRFSSVDVAKIIKEIICAVYYLHHMDPPIIHRDIKPENVLIDKNGVAKLTDFGWSNYVDSNEIRRTYCGTPVYLAPEMIKEIGHNEHLDIWCIGVLLFELLTGTVPFKGRDIDSLNNNILSLKIVWPRDINNTAKNLISKILKTEPGERISLEDMLKHPFFKEKLNNDHLEKELIKPDGLKFPPFLLSQYSIEYYDKTILENFLKEHNEKQKIEKNEIIDNEIKNDKELNHININKEGINMNSINNNIEDQNTKTMTDLNSENLDNNSIPMNSLTSLKSMENYPKEVNDAFLMNNNSTVKLFKDPKENAHDSYSSFDGKDSITSSMGGENLIQRYSSLKKEYEKLNKKYNESVAANQEKKQKIDELNSVIEELNSKLNLYQKEKEKLEKENDKVFTEKLKLQNDLEILKQKLQLNEYSLNNLKNTINIENKVDNGGDMLETVKIIQEKNEEIRKLGEKVKELEKKNDYMSIGNEQGENINSIKYEDEIKKLKEEFQKEKDNYSLIIKVKDEEIQRLVKIKEDISAQEKKKYEGYIAKYEELATEKDVEIETLKLKNKKLSKINKMLKDNSNK